MTEQEAQKFIEHWQLKHKYDDLLTFGIVDGKRVGTPTKQGREVLKRLVIYDADDVEEAGARAELKHTRGVKMGHVLAELQGASTATVAQRESPIPQYVCDMSYGEKGCGVAIWRPLAGDMVEYGIYEFRCKHHVVWFLQQRRSVFGENKPPEWTMLPPRRIKPDMIHKCDEAEQKRLFEKWRQMEQWTHSADPAERTLGFATVGPDRVYRDPGTVRSKEEIKAYARSFGAKLWVPQPAESAKMGPAPKPIAAVLPTTRAGLQYTPGSNIGKDTADDIAPF